MSKQKLIRYLIALSLIFLGSVSTFAGKPEGCQFQGSWMGYNQDGIAYWMSTADGMNASSGTYKLDVAGFDATLNNTFPTAVKYTTLRGAWERIDDYAFSFTVIGLLFDSDGNTVWISKLSGTDTLSEDCSTMTIENALEVFLGNQNPFEDTPIFAIPLPPHIGYRMRVDPPAF